MWLSPLYNCFNIIVTISILVQITNVLSKEQQFQNLTVSTSRYIKSKFHDENFMFHKTLTSLVKS